MIIVFLYISKTYDYRLDSLSMSVVESRFSVFPRCLYQRPGIAVHTLLDVIRRGFEEEGCNRCYMDIPCLFVFYRYATE